MDNSNSIQTITFGIVGVFFAIATGILAYLQLRSSWRMEHQNSDIEMM
jgi:hypothetical protein